MNYSTAIFLVNDDVRGVACTYEAHEGAPRKLFKTFDPGIKVDDFVVVPTTTRHEMTVVKVVEVDIEPEFDSDEQTNWIIGVVNRADFEEQQHQEQLGIDKIKQWQRKKKRRELAEALLSDVDEEDLKLLPMYSKNTQAEGA